MGNVRLSYVDSGCTDSRFVAQGLAYVASAFVFGIVAAIAARILADRVLEYPRLGLAVALIAFGFVVVGVFMLFSFLVRRMAPLRVRASWGKPAKLPDLWNDERDGLRPSS